jgi:hypothetical protein
MSKNLMSFLQLNKPTSEECDELIEVIKKYKCEAAQNPSNKITMWSRPIQYYDYVSPKLYEYDDSIVDVISNKSCVFIGKNVICWEYPRCAGYEESIEEQKYFISNTSAKEYTWENMKIFFNFV